MSTPGTTPRCWARHVGALACVPAHVEAVVRAVRLGVIPKHVEDVTPRYAAGEGGAPAGEWLGERFRPYFSRVGEGVAAIRLDGTLGKAASKFVDTSTAFVRRGLRSALADPAVASILLIVDSPGGYVAGTEDLAADVAAANELKPVVAYIEDLGASAAYWIASQAGRVFANGSARIGSIGVFAVIEDSSKAMEAEGVTVHVISTGPLKGAGAPGAPVTDEHLAAWQAEIDDDFARFAAGIRRGRGMSGKQVEAVSTGGTWGADAAKGLGLIDGVKPLDAVIAGMPKPRRAR